MARPREIDNRKHPEQSRRIKDAMKWAGIESAVQLHELVNWEWSPRTTTSRVEGDTKLTALERAALAAVLHVEPEMLEEGGPEIPDPNPAGWVAGYVVTGNPGSEQVTFIRDGQVHQILTLTEAQDRGLVTAPPPDESQLPSGPSRPQAERNSA